MFGCSDWFVCVCVFQECVSVQRVWLLPLHDVPVLSGTLSVPGHLRHAGQRDGHHRVRSVCAVRRPGALPQASLLVRECRLCVSQVHALMRSPRKVLVWVLADSSWGDRGCSCLSAGMLCVCFLHPGCCSHAPSQRLANKPFITATLDENAEAWYVSRAWLWKYSGWGIYDVVKYYQLCNKEVCASNDHTCDVYTPKDR